ncbi:MAG TPA: CBS domain-containing protein [Solirubrobacteraceae bacterium]|jgi:CBS domain-containing protein
MQIRDVMTESVVTAAPDCPVGTVAEMMRERNVGSVVLVDGGGAPVGFITDRDVTISVVADGRDYSDPAEAHASSPVITASPEMDVNEAASLMVSHGVRRLPILDGDRIVGILTLDDLAARTGDREIIHAMASELVRAQMPNFYFFERGG